MIAPQFVKPYVKSNKNDAVDAEAICQAVQRPSMRFIPARGIGAARYPKSASHSQSTDGPANRAGQPDSGVVIRIRDCPAQGNRNPQKERYHAAA